MHDAERFLEIVICLTREPDDDIGRERWLIERSFDAPAALEEPSSRVATLHCGQYAIGTTLQAQVQVRTDPRIIGESANEIVACLRRFQTAQANAKVTRQSAERIE